MGRWRVTIDGTGPHHNGSRTDADALAGLYAAQMQAQGHMVHGVEFCVLNSVDEIPVAPVATPLDTGMEGPGTGGGGGKGDPEDPPPPPPGP